MTNDAIERRGNYFSDGELCFGPDPDGDYVWYDDHIAAVAAAVLAERERCIVAARAALDGRKAVYDHKAKKAKYGDMGGLMIDLSLSQDYAFEAVQKSIRAQGEAE